MSNKSQAADQLQIKYTLSFPQPQTHYAEVEMEVSGITQPTIDLKMPVWTPGSYLVREYAKTLESFSAQAGGKAAPFVKTNKNTWHISNGAAHSIKVKYSLYCFEISVRNNFVSTLHGFITGANTFLYPAGKINNPSTIHIIPYKTWDKVSTSLESVGNDPFTVQAPNYDILFDSPIEIGTQDVFGFDTSDGVKYEIAMCLGGNYDKERLKKDLKILVEKETEIFGENPNKRYVFIVHNYSKSGGGLEHMSSTVLGAVRDGYGTEAGYQRFLALASHEHFHTWNVKRLRPIALGPFDYETENYTTNLWIAEGFTNYFDNLVIHRLGLYSTENYLTTLCGDINLIENTPGNKFQTLSEASYDAWIKYYRPTENSANSTISYYSKGTLVALMLDLEIINNSKGKYCLDDVMKEMYTEYYKIKKRGYTDDEFKKCLEKYAGKNLDDFYKKFVNGLAPVEYDKYLGYAGLQLIDDLAGTNDPTIGITFVPAINKPVIATVVRDGAAWVDGLNVNDEIVTIDGLPLTSLKDGLKDALAGKKVGDKITVNVMRDGLPYTFSVTLLKNKQVKYRIADVANPTETQRAVKNKWLKH